MKTDVRAAVLHCFRGAVQAPLLLAILLVSAQAVEDVTAKYPVDTAPIEADNQFAKLNPGYMQRVGAFYEKEYLPTAVDQLTERLKYDPSKKKLLQEILRGFLYDLLSKTVQDNGTVTNEHRLAAVASMDAKLMRELSAEQFAAYREWRNDTGGGNVMAFLSADTGGTK